MPPTTVKGIRMHDYLQLTGDVLSVAASLLSLALAGRAGEAGTNHRVDAAGSTAVAGVACAHHPDFEHRDPGEHVGQGAVLQRDHHQRARREREHGGEDH